MFGASYSVVVCVTVDDNRLYNRIIKHVTTPDSRLVFI